MQNKNKYVAYAALSVFALLSSTALANPAGEQVISGQVGFQRNMDTLTVNQSTQNAIVNWDSFSIAGGETTRFIQPNAQAAILNRVTGGDVSSLYGTLSGNGQIFLINPNGIVVGPQGTINAAGFVASTLNIADDDFLEGDTFTFGGESTAIISNLGRVEATGGNVVLIGREIVNHGTVKAAGSVALAAGSEVLLAPGGSQKVMILAGSAAGSLANSGLIEAATAELRANGGNPEALAVNTDGIIRATGVTEQDGRLILAGGDGLVRVGGTLQAKQGENGGHVEVTGARILVDDNADISVNGADGGHMYIGGGREGQNASLANAERVYIAGTARLSADGTTGNGGELIVYSTDSSQIYGILTARGMQQGGFIETSGGWLDLGTTAPDVSGLIGGTWLIDPYNIAIVAGGGNTNVNTASPFTSSGSSAQLGVDLILTALASGDVIITTSSGGAEAGDITLDTNLDFNGIGNARTLTLNAQRNITLNGTIADSVSGGESLSVIFNADSDANGLGAAVLNKNITTEGGSLTFNSAAYIAGSAALTLDVAGGDMTFNGQVQLANNNGGVVLTTNGGTITFNGALDSGNSYAYDSTLRTWTAAKTAVASGDGSSAGHTYLATITSALENSVAQSTLPAATSAWLGGSDSNSEGVWRWVAGPEGLEDGGLGRQFWQGTGSGYAVNSQYENWNSGEPNDSSGEDALQIGFGTAGEWNDFPDSSSTLGSVVETNLNPTDLTVNVGSGGSVVFNGQVGSDRELGDLTVNSGGTAQINNDVTVAGTVDVDSALSFGTTAKTTTADSLIFRQAVTANVAAQTWVADDMDIQAAVTNNVAGGVLALHQRTNGVAINLGAVGDATGSTLELSAAELGYFTVPNLRIGDSNAGALTFSDNLTLSTVGNLTLATGSTLSDGSGYILTVGGLALSAGNTITLDNGHDVDTLAIANTAANSLFVDSDGFVIGTVDATSGIAASGYNVTLSAGGAVTQNQAVVASGLNLIGTGGAYTLTNSSNNIATLAGNTASVNYLDSDALSIGTVSTVGLTTTGASQVRTASGNLTVDQNVVADGSGNTIVLAAGQHFINNAGASALDVGSSGGRYLIYSSTPNNTTLGGLSPSRQYNKTFAGNAPGTIGGTGDQVLYSYAPVLTFTATDASYVYGNPSTYAYTLSGLETGDTAVMAFSGTPTLSASSDNVGVQTLNISGSGLTNLMGYTFAFVNGQVTISPAALTITADDVTRAYAHVNPTFTATYAGLTNGDTSADITGLTLTTTATKDSPTGTYTIAAAGATNSNYTISLVDGTLTVEPFAEAEEIQENLTTFTNVSNKQTSGEGTQLMNPRQSRENGNNKQNSSKAALPNLNVPDVAVAPAQGRNNGSASMEGGHTNVLAQSSSLDTFKEENDE